MYPWHEPVSAQLRSLRERGLLPSAIALTGPAGWGHEQLLAGVALDLLETATDQPVAEFAHPDFRWIAPDGAVIKIEQIRKLVEFAVQTPQSAPRKVAALVDAHLLNTNAANALLKTLEEPPPHTHIVLATPSWGKVMPTIRSRCQRFQVHPQRQLAMQWLQGQGISVSEQEFALAGHAPLTCQSLYAADGGGADSLDLEQWLRGLPGQPLAAAVEQAVNADPVALLSRWYRRLVLALGGQALDGPAAGPALHVFADQLLSVRQQIESSNSANVRLLLESLVVDWVRLCRDS